MSEAELREVNRIPPRMLIKAGSTLMVPRGDAAARRRLERGRRHRHDGARARPAADAARQHRAWPGQRSVASVARRYARRREPGGRMEPRSPTGQASRRGHDASSSPPRNADARSRHGGATAPRAGRAAPARRAPSKPRQDRRPAARRRAPARRPGHAQTHGRRALSAISARGARRLQRRSAPVDKRVRDGPQVDVFELAAGRHAARQPRHLKAALPARPRRSHAPWPRLRR